MKLMGVATGASVLSGCDLERQSEKLIPYLVPPEDGVMPGDATFVSSSCTECPAGCAVTARIREERPVKVDGVVGHPVNGGALCVRGQASLNRLYNTERIRGPLMKDGDGFAPATWDDALSHIAQSMNAGENAFLSGRTSGTMSELAGEFCRTLGVTRLPEFEVFSCAAIRLANSELFGRADVPWYEIGKSDFLLTVGADVIETFQNPVANAAAIAANRAGDGHFTWYHAEPHASLTGYQSDHRLNVKPGTEAHLLAFLLHSARARRIYTDRRLETYLNAVPMVTADDAVTATGLSRETLEELAHAFTSAHHPLVITGGVSATGDNGLDAARLTALVQFAAGMIGSTVSFSHAPDYSNVGTTTDIAELSDRLNAGGVGVLFVNQTDPVGLSRSEGEALGDAMDKATLVVGFGDAMTATLERCDVVLPVSQSLESWGDVEPRAGVVNVIQPAFEPLFDTLGAGDILMRIMSEMQRPTPFASYQEYTMARWNRVYGATAAQQLVEKGYIETPVRGSDTTLTGGSIRFSFDKRSVSGTVVYVAPSTRWYDGRSIDLPLLNEIPDPLTTVSWGAWVSVSPESGIAEREEVVITVGGWSGRFPARTQPGLREGVFVLQRGLDVPPLGRAGDSGEEYAYVAGATVTGTSKRVGLAVLSGSLVEAGRGAVPGNPPEHFGHPHSEGHKHEDVSFNPDPMTQWKDYRWAMAVDLDLCTGCSACVAACYIENNVPVTGESEHLKGREMSWLKIAPYFDEHGNADFVPTMCQHCDAAPCESVCPVFATYTNEEGLNAQIYNRCVGTRYCANNCPYKMRRFNWYSWEHRPEPLNLMTNPDVSMRGKGIMEKCSFCSHRIRKARHDAKDRSKDKWVIEDGEVMPACAQACPGGAITFGNLLDENSRIATLARSKRSNKWLEELGTGPAVFYLRTKGNDHGA